MQARLTIARKSAVKALLITPALTGCETARADPLAAAQEAFETGQPRTALDLVAHAIDADPNNSAARMLAGDAAIAFDRPDHAIAEFERVPEGDPNFSLARAKLAEAQVMGNYLESASETLDSLPMDTALAYTATVALHLAHGETEDAYQVLDEGLAKFPDDPRLVTTDAERLWAQGKLDETLARLEPILAMSPAVTQAHLFAGQLRLSMRDQAQAKEHFEKVLSVRPLHQTAMLAMDAIARDAGDAAIRMSDWSKADAIYTSLLDGAAQSDAALLNNAAAVKTKLGQHEQAVALARRALVEAPSSPEIKDTLAWAIWQAGGDSAEARGLLQEARQGAPANREIAEHWAIVHSL